MNATFDDSPPDGSPGVLFGFVGGDEARAFRATVAGRPPRRRAEELRRLLRAPRPRPARTTSRPTGRASKWSRGGPVGIAGPGVLLDHGPALREPVGRIHWAGTETSNYWNGYMDGAVRSGEARRARGDGPAVRRAALTALRCLRPCSQRRRRRLPARARFDTRVLAQVPPPGFPAMAYVHPNGRVYVGHLREPGGDALALARARVRADRARCCARGPSRARSCRRTTACRWPRATPRAASCCSTARPRGRCCSTGHAAKFVQYATFPNLAPCLPLPGAHGLFADARGSRADGELRRLGPGRQPLRDRLPPGRGLARAARRRRGRPSGCRTAASTAASSAPRDWRSPPTAARC